MGIKMLEFIYMLIGCVVSKSVNLLFLNFRLGIFLVMPMYFYLLFFVIIFFNFVFENRSGRITKMIYISLGCFCDSVFFWILRESTEELTRRDLFSVPFLLPPFILVAAFYILSKTLRPCGKSPADRKYSKGYIDIYIAIIVIAIYRISNYLLQGIPNEDRSVFIAGAEIHHIIWGIFSLMLLMIFFAKGYLYANWLFLMVYGVILGFIFDQSLYFMLFEINDSAYNGLASYLGPVVFMLIYSLNRIKINKRGAAIDRRT